MRIAADIMGADNPPEEIIAGVIDAVNSYALDVLIVGDEKKIYPALEKLSFDSKKVSVLHAPEHVGMHDSPTEIFRTKKNASIIVAARAVRDKKADALYSPGNTGATLAAVLMTGGRVKGVARPAIVSFLPTATGETCLLLDVGANPDCKPSYLLQFAVMGEVIAHSILGIKTPRIGLLSNGEEKEKGNELIRTVHRELEKIPVNFIGNIEGEDILGGNVDVTITDGFTGNAVLKTMEGTLKSVLRMLRTEINRGIISKAGGLMLKPAFRKLKERIDPGQYGGAPLVGTNITCIVGHGSSVASEVSRGLLTAKNFLQYNVNDAIAHSLKEYKIMKMHLVWEDTIVPSSPVDEV